MTQKKWTLYWDCANESWAPHNTVWDGVSQEERNADDNPGEYTMRYRVVLMSDAEIEKAQAEYDLRKKNTPNFSMEAKNENTKR